MNKNELPLGEVSIEELFFGNVKCTYEIPIYQRNYAWEKEEITALIQDVYDSYKKDPVRPYYIGTLVSYHKGDDVYEIIDGQQRLTTIRILLAVLGIRPGNQLTYRARKKSDDTLKVIPNFDSVEEKDNGIVNGFRYAKAEVDDLLETPEVRSGFIDYFRRNVHIVHYRVPKDIDLNHYFEIMNSRGEQLEKHEIAPVKGIGRLLQKLKGRMVKLDFFDGECDTDLIMKPCRILEFDGNWAKVSVETKKGTIEKLIAISSVQSIELMEEEAR
ncbi:MAG: DUF262 domain-containing protein [Lachnospiraceae bacterium]|nr:DUF262 domain-containing protein [Lachnospiraceae bacterium]